MSKYLLRLIVVILLIAIVTTVVWLLLNRPDNSKRIYENYISLTERESYQNYEYFTKPLTDSSTGTQSAIINFNTNLSAHYRLVSAIKEQIEQNILLINYASAYDESAQDAVLDALDAYNDVAYGTNGVTYQARYLYEYYVSGEFSAENVEILINNLLIALHSMEQAGATALQQLKSYLVNNVYEGSTPEDVKYILYDARAIVAVSATSYENAGTTDELHKYFNNYSKYLTKFETLIQNGTKNGFNTLITADLMNFIDNYNAVPYETLVDFIRASDKNAYINALTDDVLKTHLTGIYSYLEATV